jgi:hypothetical protein
MESAKAAMNNVTGAVSGASSSVSTAVSNVSTSVSNALSSAKTSITNFFSQFSQGTAGSPSFLQSNTIVAKIGFIILVIIVFLILMSLGIMLITYLTGPNKNPYLVHGMVQGNSSMTISQDPNNSSSIPILRSNNESKGLEFTWSFWLFIDNLPDKSVGLQTIFCKGDGKVNNGPGVYLGPDINTGILRVKMDTALSNDTLNSIDIKNIPLRNWVHIAIRAEQKVIDVYVNGVIASHLTLNNLPKQNYSDVLIAPNGGFSGKLSNLRYYSHALNIFEINYVVMGGPNMSLVNSTKSSAGTTYLSRNWYSTQQIYN